MRTISETKLYMQKYTETRADAPSGVDFSHLRSTSFFFVAEFFVTSSLGFVLDARTYVRGQHARCMCYVHKSFSFLVFFQLFFHRIHSNHIPKLAASFAHAHD